MISTWAGASCAQIQHAILNQRGGQNRIPLPPIICMISRTSRCWQHWCAGVEGKLSASPAGALSSSRKTEAALVRIAAMPLRAQVARQRIAALSCASRCRHYQSADAESQRAMSPAGAARSSGMKPAVSKMVDAVHLSDSVIPKIISKLPGVPCCRCNSHPEVEREIGHVSLPVDVVKNSGGMEEVARTAELPLGPLGVQVRLAVAGADTASQTNCHS